MANTQYLALLGINVGGGDIIKTTALKACFEALKLENVATYIQSGNVRFSQPGAPRRFSCSPLVRPLNQPTKMKARQLSSAWHWRKLFRRPRRRHDPTLVLNMSIFNLPSGRNRTKPTKD